MRSSDTRNMRTNTWRVHKTSWDHRTDMWKIHTERCRQYMWNMRSSVRWSHVLSDRHLWKADSLIANRENENFGSCIYYCIKFQLYVTIVCIVFFDKSLAVQVCRAWWIVHHMDDWPIYTSIVPRVSPPPLVGDGCNSVCRKHYLYACVVFLLPEKRY